MTNTIKWDKPCYKCLSHLCDLSCKEALAQPEQRSVSEHLEPVAIVDSTISGHIDWLCTFFPKQGTKLYTTPPQPKEPEQKPVAMKWLAEMIMSDCGCSTNNERLLERVMDRIDQYERANTPPQHSTIVRKPLTPDMFWNQDDAETPYDSIEEFLNHEICNGYLEVDSVFTLLQAKKFPSVKIKVTSIDWNECEAEYEIIEAAHGIKE